MEKEKNDKMTALVGCIFFACWVSVAFAIFMISNSFAYAIFSVIFGIFGLVAYGLYLGQARAYLAEEKKWGAISLLAIGTILIVTVQLAYRYIDLGPLKGFIHGNVLWGAGVLLAGFWLLLMPAKKQKRCC